MWKLANIAISYIIALKNNQSHSHTSHGEIAEASHGVICKKSTGHRLEYMDRLPEDWATPSLNASIDLRLKNVFIG